MRESLYDYCRRNGQGELLHQWHDTRNGSLTPQTVSYGSKRKVWWRCEQGHQWQAMVYTRADGSGCPYCTGKLPIPGKTDLASQYPELAAQWHRTKNGDLTPEAVLPGSHRKVWWICEKGHVWQSAVKSRVSGCGCPVCADRKVAPGENDLAATAPLLAAQWCAEKNGLLTPLDVVAGTRRKVWWRCEKGHVWQATIASRTSGGVGCPVCAGKRIVPGENDLASWFPAIAGQWHPTKNGAVTPDMLAPHSNRKVWWLCERGHAYQATVCARTENGSGCPYCAGRRVLAGFNDLASLEPDVAAQWHPALNGTLTPEMVTLGSHRKVWWQCPEGHIWKAVIHCRAGPKKCGCPVCAGRTNPERQKRYAAALTEQNQKAAVAAFLRKKNQEEENGL